MILILKEEYDNGYGYYALKGIFETEEKLKDFCMDTARRFFAEFKVYNDYKEEYEFNFIDKDNIMSDPRNGGYNSYRYLRFNDFNKVYHEDIISKPLDFLNHVTDFIDLKDPIFTEIDAYNAEVRRRKEEENRPTKEKTLRKINKLEKELLIAKEELKNW